MDSGPAFGAQERRRADKLRHLEPVDAAIVVQIGDRLAVPQDRDVTLLGEAYRDAPHRLHVGLPSLRVRAAEGAGDLRGAAGLRRPSLFDEAQQRRLDLAVVDSHAAYCGTTPPDASSWVMLRTTTRRLAADGPAVSSFGFWSP